MLLHISICFSGVRGGDQDKDKSGVVTCLRIVQSERAAVQDGPCYLCPCHMSPCIVLYFGHLMRHVSQPSCGPMSSLFPPKSKNDKRSITSPPHRDKVSDATVLPAEVFSAARQRIEYHQIRSPHSKDNLHAFNGGLHALELPPEVRGYELAQEQNNPSWLRIECPRGFSG